MRYINCNQPLWKVPDQPPRNSSPTSRSGKRVVEQRRWPFVKICTRLSAPSRLKRSAGFCYSRMPGGELDKQLSRESLCIPSLWPTGRGHIMNWTSPRIEDCPLELARVNLTKLSYDVKHCEVVSVYLATRQLHFRKHCYVFPILEYVDYDWQARSVRVSETRRRPVQVLFVLFALL